MGEWTWWGSSSASSDRSPEETVGKMRSHTEADPLLLDMRAGKGAGDESHNDQLEPKKNVGMVWG